MSITTTEFNNNDLMVHPDGMAFMIENMGNDTVPEQYIRELTQNAIDAGAKKILWTVDPNHPQSKLSLIDDGVGMTGEEMAYFINRLSVSTGRQAEDGNFGIGAKITAGVRNPHGLVFTSWKNGVGSKVHFWKNPEDGRYGLKLLERSDGTMGEWTDVVGKKPRGMITKHGTQIILLGDSEDHNTAAAPQRSEFSGKNWIARYLSAHYAALPEGVDIRVSTTKSHRFPAAESVESRTQYLDSNSEQKGQVKLKGVNANWWLLKETKPTAPIENKGHVGVVFQDELYERRIRRAGHSLLSQAGLITGQDRVVIYFEPKLSAHSKIKASTARGGIVIDGENPPINDWAAQFSEKLPEPLEQYMEQLLKQAPEDVAKKLRQRLEGVRDLFRASAFQPSEDGDVDIEATHDGHQEKPASQVKPGNGSDREPGTPTEGDELVQGLGDHFKERSDEDAPGGKKGKEAKKLILPATTWVSGKDDSELEDRAAKYDKRHNQLLINTDFRGFKDLLSHLEREFPKTDQARRLLKSTTEEYYAQALVQAVIGAQELSKKGAQLAAEYDALTSPEALTAVSMIRAEIRDNVLQAMRKEGVKPIAVKGQSPQEPGL